jgi:hypothetical protein
VPAFPHSPGEFRKCLSAGRLGCDTAIASGQRNQLRGARRLLSRTRVSDHLPKAIDRDQCGVLQSWVPLFERLNFLHSPHCKMTAIGPQYCLALGGREWLPYLSGAEDVRFCESGHEGLPNRQTARPALRPSPSRCYVVYSVSTGCCRGCAALSCFKVSNSSCNLRHAFAFFLVAMGADGSE